MLSIAIPLLIFKLRRDGKIIIECSLSIHEYCVWKCVACNIPDEVKPTSLSETVWLPSHWTHRGGAHNYEVIMSSVSLICAVPIMVLVKL